MIIIPIIFTAVVAIMTLHEPKLPAKTTQEIYREGLGSRK